MSQYSSFGETFAGNDYNDTYRGEHADESQRDPESGLVKCDQETVVLFPKAMDALKVSPRSIEGMALDGMSGPSPLAQMLLSPYMADGSLIEGLEISEDGVAHSAFSCGNGNHSYDHVRLGQKKFQRVDTYDPVWTEKYNPEIAKQGAAYYAGREEIDPSWFEMSFQRSRRMFVPRYGDFESEIEHSREEYVAGVMFYGVESSTDKRYEFASRFIRFFYALQIGAPFFVALVGESKGYPVGLYTRYPAYYLKKNGLAAFVKDFGLPIKSELRVSEFSFRVGQEGILFLYGRRA